MTAATYLSRRDRTLAKVIRRVKLKKYRAQPQRLYFQTLAESIIGQQLSGKAADTITARFVALFPRVKFPKPEHVLKAPAKKLRSSGLSWAKVSFLKDLARHVHNKRLDFHKFPTWTDEEIIAHLTAVHGIGRWTAEMFLMFSLNRPDVFSTGDQGLKNAIRKLYGFKKEPTAKQMLKLAENWRPHRTAAARYLWKSLTLPQ